MKVKINKNQFEYLIYNLPDELEVLRTKLKLVNRVDQFYILDVDGDTTDNVRDWASDELQKKGFDENYELNSEGKILEELIDLFFKE